MPRSLRLPGRSPAASGAAPETAVPPEPEKLARGGETAALSGDPVEVQELEGRTAASGPQEHPAPVEGGQTLEGPDWQEEFETPELLYKRFRDVDHLRGRLANEVGQLRRQVGLYERTISLLLQSRNPVERQALIQAAGLLHEPDAHASVERLVALGEEAHEQEIAHAVRA